MQTFRVVKEPHGWAVRVGQGVCTPFWSEALAIREAERLCRSLQAHGVDAEVVCEVEPSVTPAGSPRAEPPRSYAAWR